MQMDRESRPALHALGAVGLMALTAFIIVLINIPWDWSMFMDDTLYNAWMPKVDHLGAAMLSEIRQYWALGRFYPVKYLANLLKWRYLPNDPYAFRYFNFTVFVLAAGFGAAAAIRAAGATLGSFGARLSLLAFLVGAAFLHKPVLEIISLNPLGETWVCLFFAMGSYCLFSKSPWARYLGTRVFFVLVALSKEPAALAFFGSALFYATLAYVDRASARKWLLNSALDFLLFAGFLGMALAVMAQGSFTKGAYFGTTPWLLYASNFTYKLARYALWTSPFLALFAIAHRELAVQIFTGTRKQLPAVLFFLSFGFAYDVFMASQGIVAYQQAPAAMGYFCLFSFLTAALAASGALDRILARHGMILLLLFCVSYGISISRWQRFVRGIVEPRQAVTNLIRTGDRFTLFIPRGEVAGHIDQMIKDAQSPSQVIQIGEEPYPEWHGKVVVLEPTTYMGGIPAADLAKLEARVDGWASVVNARSYRILVGKKTFP